MTPMQGLGSLPDVDSLRCFIEAARQLNFRAAAGIVGLTPAALGQRIKSLEEQLEVKLFHRTTRRVELTEAGLALLPAAERALDVMADCVTAARGEAGPVEMDLYLGTRAELGLSWITPMLPTLRSSLSHLRVHLYVGSGQDLERRVLVQDIDCAVSSRRIDDPRIEGLRLHREEYCLVVNPALLEGQSLNQPEDAAAFELLDILPELPLFRYFREADNAPDLRFRSVRSLGTIAAVRAEVLQAVGVAVLPQYLVAEDLETGVLQRVFPKVDIRHDYFRLIYRADDPRRPLFRALAEVMAQEPLR